MNSGQSTKRGTRLQQQLDVLALHNNLIGTRLVREVESLSQIHGLQLSTVLEGVGVVVDELGALEDHGDVGLIARRHGSEHEIGLH